MVVDCISMQIKKDLDIWFDRRIKNWDDLGKLHRSILESEESTWRVKCPKCSMYIDLETSQCPHCSRPLSSEEIPSLERRMYTRKKKMTKEEYEEQWVGLIQEMKEYYAFLQNEFVNICPTCGTSKTDFSELFSTIECLPKDIKQDLVPFIKRKAKEYPEPYGKEAEKLADTLQHKVALCNVNAKPSGSWLRRHGYKKSDLKTIGNITQVVKQ